MPYFALSYSRSGQSGFLKRRQLRQKIDAAISTDQEEAPSAVTRLRKRNRWCLDQAHQADHPR